MKILFCSGEAYPFSKTGGLADVAAALPKALKRLGHDVKIITPLYQAIKKHKEKMTFLGNKSIAMGSYVKEANYYMLDHDSESYIFIENDELFDRVRLYDYEDDALRFTFFNFAILACLPLLNDYPEILHINDWQTGLVPFLLDVHYRFVNKGYKNIKTLLSIHNLEKQGSYPIETEKLFNSKNYTYIHMDKVNFLKSGIMRANAINTVSENYKNEILTRFYGFGLDGALKSRQHHLFGILNGFDPDLYDPTTGTYLAQTYDGDTYTEGKKRNKQNLFKKVGFKDFKLPLIAFVNRLVRQKGIDLMMSVLEDYLSEQAFYLIIMGVGDDIYDHYFASLMEKYPQHVLYIQKNEISLAQQIYAASDLFLMPSLFEPCGLNHMIAMRYGSLPLVRETGGLKDTVTAYNKFTGIGVGFTFKNYDEMELRSTLDQALELYHQDKASWSDLIRQAMHVNHSLSKMAKAYEGLYQKIINDEI
ncbi:MAG: glycogen synthase [Acholeplasmataceae bacterium]|nr:glycogen synthase [Acholeplasmataceae bacterium]